MKLRSAVSRLISMPLGELEAATKCFFRESAWEGGENSNTSEEHLRALRLLKHETH
jgi:hypothetical protein